MGRCPPGVICIENLNLIFIVILILGVIYYFYNMLLERVKHIKQPENTIIIPPSMQPESQFLNPYKPPLKPNMYIEPQGIPINISTQGPPSAYRQIGILTRVNGAETILPLMGRSLITNRNKWQYYTISNNNNLVKLPVVNKGKSCTNEYGCDELYNSDTIYVQGYNDAFKATIYENNTLKYIPYI
jgi:hypothetical protein